MTEKLLKATLNQNKQTNKLVLKDLADQIQLFKFEQWENNFSTMHQLLDK